MVVVNMFKIRSLENASLGLKIVWTKITGNTTVVTPLFNHGNNKSSLKVCNNTETHSITIPLISNMLDATIQ